MCGRVELDLEISNPAMRRLRELLKSKFPDEQISSGEKYPSDLLPILMRGEENIDLMLMRWGFPMHGNSRQVINARSETAADKTMFKDSLNQRRGILPTTGFYEWTHDGKKKKYLFRLPQETMLYLAGIYNSYGDEQRFVILTQEANNSVADIHNRMPVIISQNEITPWLLNNNLAIDLMRHSRPQLSRAAQ